MKLEGIYAPIPTPFAGDQILYDRLEQNLCRWASTQLDGLVVLGSNGEFVMLDEDEKVEMVRFVRRNFPASRPVIAGTGCESTRATLRLTKAVASEGADAVLVVNPSYYKGAMTEAALEGFYTDVADESPVPVILYNMPRNTGINLSASLVARLSQHTSIIGVKDSSGNITQIAEVIHRASPGFSVFAGSGGFLYPSLCVGATGGTLAVANILADQCAGILRNYQEGRVDVAKSLQLRILEVNAAVTTRWGVAGLKAAMDMLGYYGGKPIGPLVPLEESQRRELRSILSRAGAV